MKNFIKIALIIFLFNSLTSCSSKTYPIGTYQKKPVIIDGDLSEWNKPLKFLSTGGEVQYNITNDNDNIYVSFETRDEATAMKILRSGVNIYIDPSAGKSKKTSLTFPLANQWTSPGSNRKEFKQSLLIQAVSFNTTGFKEMENGLYDVSDKSKIKVALKADVNNALEYEAAIPIKYILGNAQGKKTTVSVGLVINAMKTTGENHKNFNTTSNNGEGMHSGGGRGGNGSGMGSGGGGHYHRNNSNYTKDPNVQMPDRASLFKEDANWYTFKLAAK